MIEMYKPTGKVTKQMSLLENSKPDLEPKSSGSDQIWLISGSGETEVLKGGPQQILWKYG